MLPILEVVIDRNEKPKYRLRFPETMYLTDISGKSRLYRIQQTTEQIAAGDYYLRVSGQALQNIAALERKKDLDECYKNWFSKSDRVRASKAWQKFADLPGVKYLLLDGDLNAFTGLRRETYKSSDEVLDKLLVEMARLNVRLLWLPKVNPKRLGETVIRVLWSHVRQARNSKDLDFLKGLYVGDNCPTGTGIQQD